MFSRLRFLAILLACAVLSLIIVDNGWRSAQVDLAPLSPPDAPRPSLEDPDRPDHPNARWAWEVRRLADPRTGRIPPDIHRREQLFAARLPRRAEGVGLGGAGLADKTSVWSYRGPANVGGRTRALAMDVADPSRQTIVAGGVSGGMWRSEDDGANWILTTGSSQLHAVSTVAQDTRPGQQDIWYYGTGEARVASPDWNGDKYWGDGLFKSIDGARSWTQLASTSTDLPQEFDHPWDAVWRVATDASNLVEDEVYAATYGVIYRSLDGGESWTAVLGDEEQLSSHTDVALDATGVVYATLSTDGGQHGIFRSPDGVNWTDITPVGIEPTHGRITMGIAPSNPNMVYFLTSNTTASSIRQFWLYTYFSGDGSGGGGVWSDRSLALDHLPSPWDGSFNYPLVTQRGYNLTVAVNPNNANEVYIGCVHLWRSSSGFADYTDSRRVGGWLYEDRSHHADQHWLVFSPGSDIVTYTGSDGGVHRSDDIGAANVQWHDLNNGYNTSQFYTVAIDQDAAGNPVILGGTQDNGTQWTNSAEGDAPWTEVYGGDGAHCSVLSTFDGDYLVSYYFGNMRRIQIDLDGEIIRETRVDPQGAVGYQFINPFIADPLDNRIVYLATSNGVWRNDDITTIPWFQTDPATEGWLHLTTLPSSELVTALGINRQVGTTLYYGTEDAHLYAVPGGRDVPTPQLPVTLHENAGFPEGGYLSGIAVHPEDDGRLLVCFGNYRVPSLWYSDDGGATWADVEGNLAGDDGPSVRCVAIAPDGATDLWLCGTSTGIYSLMVDHEQGPGAEQEWIQEAPEVVGNVVVDALAYRDSDRKLVAATHGRGIFSATVTTTTDVPVIWQQHLRQNSPNPFNPATEITFSLATAGPVRLAVYDLQGRLVRRLHEGELPAGEHAVIWRGDDTAGRGVASGVYLYRLESPQGTSQRKMTLVR